MTPEHAMRNAVKKVGTGKIAEIVGVTSQAVSQWKRVPYRHVKKVSKASGIPVEELAPDLFSDAV